MLEDYNSSTCVMREKNMTGGMAHVCSCKEVDECNDVLNFSPGECGKASQAKRCKAPAVVTLANPRLN